MLAGHNGEMVEQWRQWLVGERTFTASLRSPRHVASSRSHLACEVIAERQNQDGGFGALQPPATILLSALRKLDAPSGFLRHEAEEAGSFSGESRKAADSWAAVSSLPDLWDLPPAIILPGTEHSVTRVVI